MKTELCEKLGIDIPIIQAPIGSAAGAPLAAAVSDAGGLGTVAVTGFGAEVAREKIREVRARTSKPFAINLLMSFPYEEELEIFVELVPDGGLTPKMWEMRVGDTMSIRPRAKGLFLLDEKVHHHFMLATVTGVAPFVSMIRQYLHDGRQGHKFYLLLGASYADELTYGGELSGLSQQHPDWIRFVPTVSRPAEARNTGWSGAKGRVNTIAEEYLNSFNLPKEDTRVYACGHPGMIVDVKEKVVPQGWKFVEERFWKE